MISVLFLAIMLCLALWGITRRLEKIEAEIRRIDSERFKEVLEDWTKSMGKKGNRDE